MHGHVQQAFETRSSETRACSTSASCVGACASAARCGTCCKRDKPSDPWEGGGGGGGVIIVSQGRKVY